MLLALFPIVVAGNAGVAAAVPVAVFSAFLGSRKTTLLNHVLVNEQGLKVGRSHHCTTECIAVGHFLATHVAGSAAIAAARQASGC